MVKSLIQRLKSSVKSSVKSSKKALAGIAVGTMIFAGAISTKAYADNAGGVSAISPKAYTENVGNVSGWNDEFEDGVIDSSLWDTGGWKFGIGGLGAGSYNWSHEEVQSQDGYLQTRLQGPTSGNTYGGVAWVKTKQDFNDGKNHTINFTWGAEVNAGHLDFYGIHITKGYAEDTGLSWILEDTSVATPLYRSTEDPGNHEAGQEDLPPTKWSIEIDGTNNTASLYLGPNLTGDLSCVKSLNPTDFWHVGFAHLDATSWGYPGTDNSLSLYSFSTESTKIQDYFLKPGDSINRTLDSIRGTEDFPITLHLAPGDYNEHVTMDEWEYIIGGSRKESIIQGSVKGIDNAVLTNLTVRDPGLPQGNICVDSRGVSPIIGNITIDGNNNPFSSGLVLSGRGSDDAYIFGNKINGHLVGVEYNNSNAFIKGNEISDCEDGLWYADQRSTKRERQRKLVNFKKDNTMKHISSHRIVDLDKNKGSKK